jgi:predicted permease
VRLLRTFLSRLWALIRSRKTDREIDDEIASHLAEARDEYIQQGLSPEDAHWAALRSFGGVTQSKEVYRQVRSFIWLEDLVRDVRLAARTLARTPGFTITSVASLAIGLALLAATVAVVNAYLLRSLPYSAADRLYHVMYAPPGPWEPRNMTALDWRSLQDVVEFPITTLSETFYLTDGEFSQSIRGQRVGRGFVEGLGVQTVAGRPLRADDFAGASEPTALIGHALWRDRYGADPGVVGRVLQVDAETRGGATESFRIVGVLSPDFYFGRDSREKVDLLVPLTSPARTYMVRLRDGVPPDFAERRITEAARAVASGLPPDWGGVYLESVHGRYVAQLEPVLIGVTVASGLVLVIVCANIAVLTLLRTMRRQKELAVRAALGAGRRHLTRMLLVEAFLLCGAALALGAALTDGALRLLAPLIETQLGRPAPSGTAAIAVDRTVLLVVGGAGLAIALSLSFLPLLTASRRRLSEAVRDRATSGDGRSIRHLRSSLIASEVAGTLILLVGCGLFIRSVVGMMQTDLGFEPERLVRGGVVLRGTDYPDAEAFSRFYGRFTERLSATTRSSVVFANWPPFAERPTQSIEVAGRPGETRASAISVTPGYFRTLGVSLRSGRDFTLGDVTGGEPVAVISETLARHVSPDGNAIGARLRQIEQTPSGARLGPWRVVIGVAADMRQTYADANVSDLYVPMAPAGRFGSFYVRTDQPPAALFGPLRAIAAELDPHAMIGEPRSVAGENRELAGTTFLTTMLTGLAVIAAFLAVLGIYGVTAYGVQQREREIAIRMALGAVAGAVARLFLKEAAAVLAVGLGLGLIGAVAASRVLANQLYAVDPLDLATLAATCVLLGSAGVLATWWPTRQASRRSPVVALKEG